MTPEQTQARITELYKDIADALHVATGEAWTLQAHGETLRPLICGPNELRLFLYKENGTQGRVSVGVFFGEASQFRPRNSAASITVAASRSSMAFAKEIKRRLLPEARQAWQEASQAYHRHLADEERAAENVQLLVAAGAQTTWQERTISQRRGVYFSARVESTSVYFDKLGGVSIEAAKQIIAILAGE